MVSIDYKYDELLISKNGKRPFKYEYTSGYYVYGKYLHNNVTACFHHTNVKKYENVEEFSAGARVVVKNTKKEGVVIGKSYSHENSYIVEYKDTNGVVENAVYTKDEIEEIVNYTCLVKDITTKATKDMIFPTTDYKVKVGDVLIFRGNSKNDPYVCQVIKVNTKNKNSNIVFEGEVLSSIKI